jgi:L-threonylcarbamoyladenylate synthase
LSNIAKAIEILRAGGLVAFPTETVYGLGADARNGLAVGKIFSAKGRPATNPLIVHVGDVSIAKRYVERWPVSAEKLAAAFWPGPLTLVLGKNSEIVDLVTAGGKTVALRAPDHPVALELLREFDGPIAAPSANRSMRVSPTMAEHVKREMGDRVDLILDGGACRVGIESTVLDLTRDRPMILRLGMIGREQIEPIVGDVDVFEGSVDVSKPAVSPGQQAVHYSPRTPAFWFETGDAKDVLERFGGRRVIVLTLGNSRIEMGKGWRAMKMPGKANLYAQRLYAALHEADGAGAEAIWIELPPASLEWEAVLDRIHRACRPMTEMK